MCFPMKKNILVLGDTANITAATIIIMHVERAIFSFKINGTLPTLQQVNLILDKKYL